MVNTKDWEPFIDFVKPHTMKKVELVERYVKAWSHKLLQLPACDGIVFIDCMCSSGIYRTEENKTITGTPTRVAKYLASIMPNYPAKKALCYFNDHTKEKVEILKTLLPADTRNFQVKLGSIDCNEFLGTIQFPPGKKFHCLLIYDPYEAAIDWGAISPFLRTWSDIIINHMVSDSIRAVSQAKRSATIRKYVQTYQTPIEGLIALDCDQQAFENKIKIIMTNLSNRTIGPYYLASFPFFNSRNSLIYNLILGSRNKKAFMLFKKTAWKTFGGKSSIKDTRGKEYQLAFNFNGEGSVATEADEYCYYPKDIAAYLFSKFTGKSNVPFQTVWESLDLHPVFPSECYRKEIKSHLRDYHGCTLSKSAITFPEGG